MDPSNGHFIHRALRNGRKLRNKQTLALWLPHAWAMPKAFQDFFDHWKKRVFFSMNTFHEFSLIDIVIYTKTEVFGCFFSKMSDWSLKPFHVWTTFEYVVWPIPPTHFVGSGRSGCARCHSSLRGSGWPKEITLKSEDNKKRAARTWRNISLEDNPEVF